MEENLRALLTAVREGSLDVEEALRRLGEAGFVELGFACLDTGRAERRGFPEVIFCPGKTPDQVAELFSRLAVSNPNLLATRATRRVYRAVQQAVPEAEYSPTARLAYLWRERPVQPRGMVLVVSAGTADLPVAEEAALTAEVMGSRVERLYDVGVAGLHRLLGRLDRLRQARVLVVVAGMEGALASVVGGLVARPVIAVPTSVGYGASFRGLAALLTMLNSCAAGVAVVNIDNGFGAGYLASLINRLGD
ncbi:MAG: nickel pincer cofactor biosynthesis protein LarB [Clostridia bacterium]|nr:nickel pincer cofactor biosynthesis protein LarB [Clostridia bacterium]MDH7572586.1 nickel pincer cofactor biosynthesis protein LarB [Clostridia bacterium]